MTGEDGNDAVILTYGVSNLITVGATYKFRYRGRNIHGWGPYSDELELIAARKTDQPSTVVTSNEATYIRITWAEPSYNGGTPILGYRIKIKANDGTFIEDIVNCNGADQTTKANMFC